MSKRRKVDAKGRNTGQKFVMLHRWLLRSGAWQGLSLAGRCLLVELYEAHNGENNGDLFLAVRDAAQRLNISKSGAARAFNELEDAGFIRANQRGDFDWKTKQATTWILTEFPYAGQPATKDFMRATKSEHSPTHGTVSPTHGTVTTEQGTKTPLTVPPTGLSEHKSSFHGPTHGTHLVYHGGGEAEPAPGNEAGGRR